MCIWYIMYIILLLLKTRTINASGGKLFAVRSYIPITRPCRIVVIGESEIIEPIFWYWMHVRIASSRVRLQAFRYADDNSNIIVRKNFVETPCKVYTNEMVFSWNPWNRALPTWINNIVMRSTLGYLKLRRSERTKSKQMCVCERNAQKV